MLLEETQVILNLNQISTEEFNAEETLIEEIISLKS